jgi:hypothetical protein
LDRQVFVGLKQALPINDRSVTDSLSRLVRVLLREGKWDEARGLIEAYLDEAKLKLAPGDPGLDRVLKIAAQWSAVIDSVRKAATTTAPSN